MADCPEKSSSPCLIRIDPPDAAHTPPTRRKRMRSIFRPETRPDRDPPHWPTASNSECRLFPPAPSESRRALRTPRALPSAKSPHSRSCPPLFPNAHASPANLPQRECPHAAPPPISGRIRKFRRIVRTPANPLQPTVISDRNSYSPALALLAWSLCHRKKL